MLHRHFVRCMGSGHIHQKKNRAHTLKPSSSRHIQVDQPKPNRPKSKELLDVQWKIKTNTHTHTHTAKRKRKKEKVKAKSKNYRKKTTTYTHSVGSKEAKRTSNILPSGVGCSNIFNAPCNATNYYRMRALHKHIVIWDRYSELRQSATKSHASYRNRGRMHFYTTNSDAHREPGKKGPTQILAFPFGLVVYPKSHKFISLSLFHFCAI